MSTIEKPPPPVEAIDAGVIDDARRRHRQHRRYGYVVGLAVVAAGVLTYIALNGDGRTRRAPARLAAAAASVKPLNPAAFTFFARPLPTAGSTEMSVYVQDPAGDSWGNSTVYPGTGAPATQSGGGILAYVPADGDPDVLLFVASGVVAVRVGDLGTIAAQRSPGLPAGDKVVAFRLPQHGGSRAGASNLAEFAGAVRAPRPTLTAIDDHGHVIRSSPQVVGPQGTTPRMLSAPTAESGQCAVTGTLPGLATRASYAASLTSVRPSTMPGPLLSCFDTTYTFKGAYYTIAILVNAYAPGRTPAPLWGAQPVPGQPGMVEMKPSTRVYRPISPLLARRSGNAWLIESADEAFHRTPSLAQRIEVLNALHISRLDLSH